MSAETSTYSTLSTHTGLTALVSKRIYPLVIPAKAELPCVTYLRVSGIPENDLDGNKPKVNVRVQIDAWALSYAAAKAVAEQVKIAMRTIVPCTIQGDMDLYEDETRIYRVSMDFSLWE